MGSVASLLELELGAASLLELELGAASLLELELGATFLLELELDAPFALELGLGATLLLLELELRAFFLCPRFPSNSDLRFLGLRLFVGRTIIRKSLIPVHT